MSIHEIQKLKGNKEAIEELKIVQDILLKQEAYSLGALHQALIIIASLVIAYFSEKTKLNREGFILISELIFLGFLYVQATYREAFYKGLERSHYLQKLIGGRLFTNEGLYSPFQIYENVHHPMATWRTFRKDLNNTRFIVPNLVLFLIPVAAAYLKNA